MSVVPFRRTKTQRIVAAARMLARLRREFDESPRGKEMRRRYEEEKRAREGRPVSDPPPSEQAQEK